MKIQRISTNNILTKSNTPLGGYCANPYVGCSHACKYCYASFMKRFTGHTEEWGSFLDVKDWEPIVNIKKYNGAKILIGSVTDPYNPQEEEYERTRALLEELSQINVTLTIITKSDLILRDLDLLKQFKNLTVAWSINTLDEGFKNDMDCASSIKRRLDAMERFYKAGIRTVCFISPIFPGITNVFDIIERVKNQCDFVWLENLNLRGNFRQPILSYIATHHADKFSLYKAIYMDKDNTYWRDLADEVKAYCQKHHYPYADNITAEGRATRGKPTIVNYFFHEEVRGSNNTGIRQKRGE